MPGQAAAVAACTRRLRLASSATVLVALCVVLALIALAWPAARLARLSVVAGTGGGLWWAAVPFGVVGFVVAWRKPGNPLGWCLVAMSSPAASARTAASTP